jgi:hypothetical protein
MLTIIFLFAGALLVIGAVILVMRSGAQSGRLNQSGEPAVRAQRLEKVQANRTRAVGEDD